MPVTQRDLAGYAGVSVATVSLALKGDGRVAAETRRRIRELADQFGYVPNSLGRALRAQRSWLIGYLLPCATSSFYNELIEGINEVALADGYGVIVSITGEQPETERRHLRLLREKRADGLIVSHCHRELVPELHELEQRGVPVVFCDFERPDPAFPEVRVDDVAATTMATDHLLDLGHHRLAYCFCVNENARSRFRACSEATGRRHLAPPAYCEGPDDLRRLLTSDERPTGVVAYSDLHAVDAKHVAEAAGLRVPDDLSVVGFDDVYFAAWPELSLTTIAQPRKEIGRAAARTLLDRLAGGPARDTYLTAELVVRSSTAAPPA